MNSIVRHIAQGTTVAALGAGWWLTVHESVFETDQHLNQRTAACAPTLGKVATEVLRLSPECKKQEGNFEQITSLDGRQTWVTPTRAYYQHHESQSLGWDYVLEDGGAAIIVLALGGLVGMYETGVKENASATSFPKLSAPSSEQLST